VEIVIKEVDVRGEEISETKVKLGRNKAGTYLYGVDYLYERCLKARENGIVSFKLTGNIKQNEKYKIRTFVVADVVNLIWDSFALYHINKKSDVESFSGSWKSTNKFNWEMKLCSSIKNKFQYCVPMDFANYDGTLSLVFTLICIGNVVVDFVKMQPKASDLLYIYENFLWKSGDTVEKYLKRNRFVFTFKGRKFVARRGLPSGSKWTSWIGQLITKAICLRSIQIFEKMSKRRITYSFLACQGDDTNIVFE
jgi:hypothetical protein